VHHVVSVTAFYTSTVSVTRLFVLPSLFYFTINFRRQACFRSLRDQAMSEGSTPFINMRWMLLKLNMATQSYTLTTVLPARLVCSCASCPSCLFGTRSTTHALPMCQRHPFTVIASLHLPLDVLNIYWYNKIVKCLKT